MAQSDINWLKSNSKSPEISDLGEAVASILGDLYKGIYHLENSVLFHRRVKWDSCHSIEIVVNDEFASFDGNLLTRLVVLAHDKCVRVSVRGASHGYLRLMFHPRERHGSIWEYHPGLEEHVSIIREGLSKR